MFGPKGDALLGVGLIAPQQLPVKWTLATQSTGKRDISGFTFEGTRIVQSAEGDPHLKYTIEKWYSDELKLTGLEVASGADENYTARIEHLNQEEPNPSLFTIPSDKIVDVDLK